MNNYWFLSWELLSSWLITYGLHSTIWLAGLGLLLGLTRKESFAVREFCWRLAIPLGVLTSIAGFCVDSRFRWNVAHVPLTSASEQRFQTDEYREIVKHQAPTRSLKSGDSIAPQQTVRLAADPTQNPAPSEMKPPVTFDVSEALMQTVGRQRIDAQESKDTVVIPQPATIDLVRMACLVWLAVCAWHVVSWAMAAWRLHRTVQSGRSDDVLDKLMGELGNRANLKRLPRAIILDGAAQPFTVGWLRPIIVVPRRALSELARDQLLALLAHELGHVQSRHAVWLSVLNLVCRLGFFQPLNIWAYRCWRREAELVADRWATHYCVQPQTLASCLVNVAAWQITSQRTLGLHFIGRRREALVERVECLVGRNALGSKTRDQVSARISWVIGVVAILLATLGPKFSSASPRNNQDANHPLVAQMIWSDIQQEWQSLRSEMAVLSRISQHGDEAASRQQLSALLEKFERVDEHYQEVLHTIDQEVER